MLVAVALAQKIAGGLRVMVTKQLDDPCGKRQSVWKAC